MSDHTLSSRRTARTTLSNGRYSSGASIPNSNGIGPAPPLSENVRRLQESLQLLFSDRDRAAIIQILEDFQQDRDVPLFAENLRAYIDSPIKEKHFLPRLRRVFPRAELPELDRRLRGFGLASVSDSTSSGVESAAEEVSRGRCLQSALVRKIFKLSKPRTHLNGIFTEDEDERGIEGGVYEHSRIVFV